MNNGSDDWEEPCCTQYRRLQWHMISSMQSDRGDVDR